MKLLRHYRFRILAGLGLLGLALLVGATSVVLRIRRLEYAYETIQLGDSRERLLELAGPVDAIGGSNDPDRRFRLKTYGEDFRYGFLYQSWFYSFDRKGKLEQKVSCALAEYCSEVRR